MEDRDDTLMDHVNTSSRPGDLKVTDIGVVGIVGASMHCILVKVYTDQGLVGYGEVRDGRSRNYVLALKSHLIDENPCNIDKLFCRIRQLGSPARQGGGIRDIELALWDLAGKAYGVPVHQMLGGKFRDHIRMYRDTDIGGKHTGKEMGEALRKRMEKGFTFLKMDLGIDPLYDIPGTLCAPLGMVGDLNQSSRTYEAISRRLTPEKRSPKNRMYDMQNIPHPFIGVQVTEYGYDIPEQYVKDVRSVIGYEIPLAIDHSEHIGVESCIRLARRIEKYNIAWMEDLISWQLTGQYVKLRNSTTVPICTGEDTYLRENFRPLMEWGGMSVIHPDILTSGGIPEDKKIGDMVQEYGVAIAVHMAESPIVCMAVVHSTAATENFLALEFHSVNVPWWPDLVTGLPNPIVDNGHITMPGAPGLRIEDLEDEVIRERLHPDYPDMWVDTPDWDNDYSHDHTWL